MREESLVLGPHSRDISSSLCLPFSTPSAILKSPIECVREMETFIIFALLSLCSLDIKDWSIFIRPPA